MQFALLVYESPEAFAARKNDHNDPYIGAWRAYYKALVEAGVYVGGDPLEMPETATTVQIKDARRRVQDGPYADTKEQLGGFIILELPSVLRLTSRLRCQSASVRSDLTVAESSKDRSAASRSRSSQSTSPAARFDLVREE